MSQLHREIIERYKNYVIGFKLVELDRNHYLFHIIANGRAIMSGTAIPLGTYDSERNTMIWSDSSHTLDKTIVKEVRDIRKEISEEVKESSLDFLVMTRDEIDSMLGKISNLLKKEIILDEAEVNTHIYLVHKLLTDER